jgi:acetoin utilization protein AcuC
LYSQAQNTRPGRPPGPLRRGGRHLTTPKSSRKAAERPPAQGLTAERFLIVYGPELARYTFGPDHPLQASRYTLTMALLGELGWLDAPGIEIVPPRFAALSQLLTVHSYPYVQAVQQGQAIARGERPSADLTLYGLGTTDDPLFPQMHDAATLYTGATIQGMQALLDDAADHAYCPAGGQHHAHRSRASGFCIYNDSAAAITLALQAERRVAYLDLDAHHGDGVQETFYADPRALTVSIHESGRYLFPGTGDASETGTGAGKGACVNIPLQPGAGNAEILRAFEQVAAPAIEAFAPDLLVTQIGADAHHADPLTDLDATLPLYPRLAARLHELVHSSCCGRWLIVGGGGYDPFDVTPRAWAAFVGTVLGHVASEVALPQAWLEASRAAGGRPPQRLLDDDGPC